MQTYDFQVIYVFGHVSDIYHFKQHINHSLKRITEQLNTF